MKFLKVCAALAAIALLAQPALAGDVNGTVKKRSPQSVVWLEGGAISASGGSMTISQQNRTFSPPFMVVRVGQTVNMLNNDVIAHNVFSQSPTKTFNLGIYPKGQSKPVKFDKPGVVELRCTIHSTMRSTLVVVPNAYYATPAGNGSFRIKNVPPGKYTLKYWSAGGGLQSKSVTVAGGGLKVDI